MWVGVLIQYINPFLWHLEVESGELLGCSVWLHSLTHLCLAEWCIQVYNQFITVYFQYKLLLISVSGCNHDGLSLFCDMEYGVIRLLRLRFPPKLQALRGIKINRLYLIYYTLLQRAPNWWGGSWQMTLLYQNYLYSFLSVLNFICTTVC